MAEQHIMEEQKGTDDRKDIEQLLSEGVTIQLAPNGYSMYPMFIPGRDQAVIAPADPARLKRGDVALYRREESILVLHRIWKKKPEGFYFVGDNQTEVEGPLSPGQIKGVLVAFVRKGRRISVKNPVYRAAASLWLFLRPVRDGIKKPLAWAKKHLKKKR